jgi:hypothetical protein
MPVRTIAIEVARLRLILQARFGRIKGITPPKRCDPSHSLLRPPLYDQFERDSVHRRLRCRDKSPYQDPEWLWFFPWHPLAGRRFPLKTRGRRRKPDSFLTPPFRSKPPKAGQSRQILARISGSGDPKLSGYPRCVPRLAPQAPRGGHPCCSANTPPLPGVQRTFTSWWVRPAGRTKRKARL